MKYTTYLRWGVLAGIFLVLAVPFIISDGLVFQNLFFPYITGKNIAFRILVELSLLLYVVLACAVPKYRPKASHIMWAVVALVAWMGLATVFSVDPTKSFWSNFERMDGYINLLHLFVWFVVAGAVLTADDLWGRFLNTSIGLSMVQGAIALFQVLHLFNFAPSSQSGARADTTFGNATYLAVYMLFNIFITLFMFARSRRTTTHQVVYGLALVLQFVALFFTETRGAQLGVVGGLVVAALWVLVFAREPQFKTLRRWIWWLVGGLIVVAVLFVAARNTSFVQHNSTLNRIASISLSDPTVASRLLYIWPTALKGIKEKPVLGWGEENFNFVFNKYYQPAMYNQEQWFDRAHNQFLDFGIAGGVPALLLYVSLFALAAWAVWRSRLSAPEQGILVGLLAGYAFNNLFVFDNLVSFFYFFALLAFVHGLSRKELPGWLFLSKPMGLKPLSVVAPLVAIAVLGGAWYFNVPAMARASTLVQAVGPQQAPQQNITLFQSALSNTAFPGNPVGYQEVTEQLAQLASNQAAPSSIDPTVKQQYLSLSADALQTLMIQRPHDARLELFMGVLLTQFGNYDAALTYLKAASADSPQKQQILMQLGLTELQAGKTGDAITALRTAFEEEPAYDTARVLYASAFYYTGDQKSGDALLVQKWGSVIVDNDQLLQVYTNTKQWPRAEDIWQLRIQGDPNNAQLHLGLASVYFQAGDTKSTIAELQKVGQLSPQLAAQMQTLISQIQSGALKPQ